MLHQLTTTRHIAIANDTQSYDLLLCTAVFSK